jgi:cyanophycin synthetase
MAARTSRKRKPAGKSAAKRAAAKAGPSSGKAKRDKPAKAGSRRAPAAAAPASAAASDIVLSLAKETRSMPGCGFGIDQAMLLGAIDVRLPDGFDLEAVEAHLEEFAIAPPEPAPAATGMLPEARLVSRIHAWHAAIQRGLNLPVFGGCRLWDAGTDPGGVHRIRFAVPGHTQHASLAALQFVIETVTALASRPATPEEVLPARRRRFAALRQSLARHALLGINPMHFIEAAHALGIEHAPWVEQVWAYGLGRNRVLLNSTVSSKTPQIGVTTAKDKLKCSAVLRAAGLPVAQSGFAPNVEAAAKLAQHIGYPVVIKPADLDQGAGVTAGIEDEADLRRAFEAAAKVSKRVMIEKHHYGRDYRVTVLHGRVIKVMDRRPGGVTGDGKHTVARLVELSNDRDKAMRAKLRRQRAPMRIDEEAQKLLAARGYDADSVISEGEFVPLRRRANISAGGTYEILPPDALHPDNRMLAVNAAVALGLDIAGIDVISEDPAKSWRETDGIIVEVNAQPQIGYRDTEAIFGEILMALMGGKGDIPVHLVVTEDGFELPAPLPQLAAGAKCNAAAAGTSAWIAGAGELGPFANSFRAARGVLRDTRTAAAVVAMTEADVLRFGLPAARLASIQLVGAEPWQPSPSLQQLIAGHSKRIVRQRPAPPRVAAGAAQAG